MKPSQLARQLRLIDRLHSVRGCTIAQLALDLEVSRRTVFRDLRSLEDAGMELRLDAENRYQLEPHFGFHASKLFDEELLAVALAAATSPLAATPDIAARLDQALGKLTAKTPAEQKGKIARVLEAFRFRLPDQTEIAGKYGMIRRIIAAIADDDRIDITYANGENQQTHLGFKPAFVRVDDGAWRLEGRVAEDPTLVAIPMRQIMDVQPCGVCSH